MEHVCNVYEMNSWHTREKISFTSATISKVFHFWTHFSFLPNPLFLPPPPAPRIAQSCNGRRWQLYHRSVHVTHSLSSVLVVIETFWWFRCFSNCLWSGCAFFSLSLSRSLFLVFPSFIIQIQFSFLSKWYWRRFFLHSLIFTEISGEKHHHIYVTCRSKWSCRFVSPSHWCSCEWILDLCSFFFFLRNRFPKNKTRQTRHKIAWKSMHFILFRYGI